ncbi:hypothetical protein ACCO45_000663 [Purpureocillium lilacinum]|uniref:Uncharacterized protein n=1 Tax=Purpureocillium lilacinum TaxID=33203 RepID=A0ACC4E7E7_PURLI
MTPGRIGARGRGYLVGTRISVGSIVERDMSALMCDVGGAYVQREWSYLRALLLFRDSCVASGTCLDAAGWLAGLRAPDDMFLPASILAGASNGCDMSTTMRNGPFCQELGGASAVHVQARKHQHASKLPEWVPSATGQRHSASAPVAREVTTPRPPSRPCFSNESSLRQRTIAMVSTI